MDKKEIRRAKLKQAAALRAEFNFETAMRRIDHRVDVVDPAVKAIDEKVKEGKKPILEIDASDA